MRCSLERLRKTNTVRARARRRETRTMAAIAAPGKPCLEAEPEAVVDDEPGVPEPFALEPFAVGCGVEVMRFV